MVNAGMQSVEHGDMAQVWQMYFAQNGDYRILIADTKGSFGGCGWIHEIDPMPLSRRNESLAIAIMDRLEMPISEPHLHPEGSTEVYIVLEGKGTVVVGRDELGVQPRSVVEIPARTAHYTIPFGRLVMAVVITPPFGAGNYIKVEDLSNSDESIGFDADRHLYFARTFAARNFNHEGSGSPSLPKLVK